MIRMDDTGSKITILKLDVEGFEFKIIPQILKDGMFNIIDQIVFEVHSDYQNDLDYEKDRSLEDMVSMLNNLQTFYVKGRRIVNYAPNLYIERKLSTSQKYYTNFDVTLMRDT
jgi:hypothetical protein